jgi:hypothetical protein
MTSHRTGDISRVLSCFSCPDLTFQSSWTYGHDVVTAYNRCVSTLFLHDEIHVLVVASKRSLVDIAVF